MGKEKNTGYDWRLALRNAQQRAANAYSRGGGNWEAISAAFAPNRTETGDVLYNAPTNYSGPENTPLTFPAPAEQSQDTGGQEEEYYNPYSSTGGSGTTLKPNNASVGDRTFDLNDPGQLQEYINAIDSRLNSDFEFYKNKSESSSDEDIADARAQEESAIKKIDLAIERLGQSKEQYGVDYTRSLADLAEGFKQGTARRQSFYASVAPRVYQSSQGTSQEYAQGKYGEGQTRYGEANTRAQRAFGDTGQEYAQNRQDIGKQTNLFASRRARQSQDEIANQARNVEDLRGQARANTLNYSDAIRQGRVDSNKFSTPTFSEQDMSQYKPANVDLNDLMQFIKFQPAGVNMGASGNQFSQNVAPVPEAGGQALNQYKGYQPQEEEPETINAYKKGYSQY